ncbi:MAG: hypothetical protein RBJ76_26105 [Stenomitos frigidus ULC029]
MKRMLIAVCLAVASVGAVAFYYWQQATQLPEWYASSQPDSLNQLDQAGASTPLANRPTPSVKPSIVITRTQPTSQPSAIVTQPSQPVRAVSQAPPKPPTQTPTKTQQQKELTQLFTNEITRKVEDKKLGAALKGTNTTIQNGNIESGAVVNFKDISLDQLPPAERDFVTKLVTAFPALGQQSFYIGIEGKPTIKDGQAQLNDDMRIKLGKLSFTPAQLSERLGIPEEQIRQQIQLQVQLGNLTGDLLSPVDDRGGMQNNLNP